MRVAITFGPQSLAFRKTMDFHARPTVARPDDAGGFHGVFSNPGVGDLPRYEPPGSRIVIGGSVCGADDWARVRALGATHCLCVTDPPDVGVPEELSLHAPIVDDGTPFPDALLDRVVSFARGVLAGGGKLYLHCWVGASRSPSFAYAVMRAVYGTGPEETLAALRAFYPYQPTYGLDPKHQSYIAGIERWLRARPTAGIYDDPRGLTGSEYGVIRVAEEMAAIGHDVTLFTETTDTEWSGVKLRPLSARSEIDETFDAAISWSEPDTLRETKPKLRVLYQMLNGWTYCRPGLAETFDLGIAVSPAHLDKILNDWKGVGSDNNGQPVETYEADHTKWSIVPLGCDPDRLVGDAFTFDAASVTTDASGVAKSVEGTPAWHKVPGSVIYCSSPDRGLHWLLQEWPAIKRAVPHATLEIYYRLGDWLKTFDTTGYFPPIEPNRTIVNYVKECLRRFADVGGLGVTVHDSVSRNEIQRAQASAEVLCYPVDTMSWSEAFSCSILECCAARACPIITDCDALPSVYGEALPLVKREGDWVPVWRDQVIRALTDEAFRNDVNEKARKLAEGLTWRRAAEQLLAKIQERLPQ